MSDTDTQELIINNVLAYIVYAINKSTRDNLVTVLDDSFTDKEVSDVRDVLWSVGGVELLGECPVVTTLPSVPDAIPHVVTYMMPWEDGCQDAHICR